MNRLIKYAFMLTILTLLVGEMTFFAIYFRVPQLLSLQRMSKYMPLASTPTLKLYGMDWLPPELHILNYDKSITLAATEFIVSSNEEITTLKLPEEWKLIFIRNKRADAFEYILRTGNIPDGVSKYQIIVEDKFHNKLTRDLTITATTNRQAASEWPDSKYYLDADSLVAVANKTYRLPEDYVPQDLVSLSDKGIKNNNSARLRSMAADALAEMTKDIKAAGIDYTVTSAYRSYTDQVNAYNFWVKYYAGDINAADNVSARPGYSEHQLGTTLDFVTSANNNVFYLFENTPLSQWLATNAYKYGFVMSYPKGKTDITGYSYEPWHYRYIGKENALALKAANITLTEWLYQVNRLAL